MKNSKVGFRAALLKERIYATFILLAVLLAINPSHTTPTQVIVVLIGTVLSLWAASIVASRMSHRIVYGKNDLDHLGTQLAQHRPLLYAAAMPTIFCVLAVGGVLSLAAAVNISIVGLLFLLVVWSLLSASALKAGRGATLLLAGIELLLGLLIIGLKLIASH